MMNPLGIGSYTIGYEGFLDKANQSLTPAQVRVSDYAAVFVGGGYGNLFDVASEVKLLSIIAQVYEAGGVLGSCGHGAGVYANVTLANGKYLVEGRLVAGFPNSTEKQSRETTFCAVTGLAS